MKRDGAREEVRGDDLPQDRAPRGDPGPGPRPGRQGPWAVIEVRPTPSISSVAISLEVSSDLPSKAAQTARRFLDQVLDLMRDEGNIFKSASRELAYA